MSNDINDNSDNNDFLYAETIALDHDSIGAHPERISKITPFIDRYNWKDINFSEGPRDWKKFERDSKSNHLKILFAEDNSRNIRLA